MRSTGDGELEVAPRDAGDDPERLAHRVTVPGRLLPRTPLQQVGDPAGELDDLQPARDLAARVGEHLAVLASDQAGQVVGVARHQVPEREQDLFARRPSEESRQAGNALRAAATARSTVPAAA